MEKMVVVGLAAPAALLDEATSAALFELTASEVL